MFSSATWKRLVLPTLLTGAILLPASLASAETVTIRQGETLGILAAKYNLTVEQLKIANHLKVDAINAGATLYIPPQSTVYTVQSGDTMGKLAARYQTTVAKIQESNQLSRDSLLVGEKILIPTTSKISPAPAPSTTPTLPEGGSIHNVVSGDVLWKIADRYKVSIQSIVDANKLTSFELHPGQKLVIAAKSTSMPSPQPAQNEQGSGSEQNTYTVVSGDMLWKIADRFKVSIQSIVDANKLTTYPLNIGQVLVIPQNGTSSAPSTKPTESNAPEQPATPEQPQTPTSEQTDTPVQTEPPGSDETDKGTTTPDSSNTGDDSPASEPDADEPWVEMTEYTVQEGETAWSISMDHGIPMSEFLQVNKLGSNGYLSIGQVVKIPVHHIPQTETPGSKYGEYLDWFEAAQYVFPINAEATVKDFKTGKEFQVKRTIGAFHSDTEPVTSADSAIIKEIWGGNFSWAVRPVIVEVDGRRIAASMASMPHDVEFIKNNDFDGHFDIHFLNSLRHKDSRIDQSHQAAIKIAAGIE